MDITNRKQCKEGVVAHLVYIYEFLSNCGLVSVSAELDPDVATLCHFVMGMFIVMQLIVRCQNFTLIHNIVYIKF